MYSWTVVIHLLQYESRALKPCAGSDQRCAAKIASLMSSHVSQMSSSHTDAAERGALGAGRGGLVGEGIVIAIATTCNTTPFDSTNLVPSPQ